MSRAYASIGTQTTASPTDTALTIQSTTALRPEVYYLSMGCTGSPTDVQLRITLQRFTTDDGTGSGITPNALRDGYPAATCVVQSDHTGEPSAYTAGEVPLDLPFNTRATHQWIAIPDSEINLPAVATEGIGIAPVHASATNVVLITMYHRE